MNLSVIQHMLTAKMHSPLGQLIIVGDEDAVCMVEFCDRRNFEKQMQSLRKYYGAEIASGETAPMRAMRGELEKYFAGELRSFSTPIKFAGSPLQQCVWAALLAVPYAETRSYAHLARAIERPTAVRAVARAVGENRLAIVLPCHRIVGADGRLTGYSGGLTRKRFLLDLETGHPAHTA